MKRVPGTECSYIKWCTGTDPSGQRFPRLGAAPASEAGWTLPTFFLKAKPATPHDLSFMPALFDPSISTHVVVVFPGLFHQLMMLLYLSFSCLGLCPRSAVTLLGQVSWPLKDSIGKCVMLYLGAKITAHFKNKVFFFFLADFLFYWEYHDFKHLNSKTLELNIFFHVKWLFLWHQNI